MLAEIRTTVSRSIFIICNNTASSMQNLSWVRLHSHQNDQVIDDMDTQVRNVFDYQLQTMD